MRLELIRAALTGSDPVRAALAGLIIMASNELDTPDLWVHSRSAWDDAIANAEQALTDEPAVPDEGREPAAVTGQPNWRGLCEELLQALEGEGYANWADGPDGNPLIENARAVLARWGNLKGSLTSSPPADGEVAECAAELLQRQALVPVSVSERLPGPEDCVPHPRTKRGNWCWGFERCEVSLARPARWRLMHMETVEMEASHWLPFHAMPVPEVSE